MFGLVKLTGLFEATRRPFCYEHSYFEQLPDGEDNSSDLTSFSKFSCHTTMMMLASTTSDLVDFSSTYMMDLRLNPVSYPLSCYPELTINTLQPFAKSRNTELGSLSVLVIFTIHTNFPFPAKDNVMENKKLF
ncbi:hypothetical protein AVEN_76262-1 [Araneus ventricosus]|uniref:Uncharacterized protein n=1 Tax=Araneus ventricosus TaxID=182803 RepID=A0A4Y2LYJ3_ARAVE|nr:hypothetical protein AVEN_76262-1 [Araneus ventricosus]